jgi:AbrB family looped-hinge helix DNA binding protein
MRKGRDDMLVRLNSKGYITIPADLRRRLGIQPGMRFAVTADGTSIFLTPMTDARLRPSKGRGVMKAFLEEKKREREL